MTQMPEREKLIKILSTKIHPKEGIDPAVVIADFLMDNDVVPIVRCQDCINAVPLDRNCELNETAYLHCNLWRGEETKNVWHKYKKYYKDYSLVDRDGFCSSGERMNNETD